MRPGTRTDRGSDRVRLATGLNRHLRETTGDVAMRTPSVRTFTGLIALVIATAAPIARAGDYRFTNFDGLGDHTNGTTANGINNNGAVVGFSTDPAGNLTNWIRNPDGTFT